jgi:heat-inducible transcriptional repressor
MAFENLSEREKQILYNLIDYYIASAGPVGSRVIAGKFKMGISSATVRNTLQDLEDMGLVQQPHTSAGRIPTDLGYRVYVDYLLKPEALTQIEKEAIKDSILKEGRGVNEILGQTCKVLGDITRQLGVTIAPKFEEGALKRLELIPVAEERIMVVVVVESGLARSVILEVETAISDKDLREVEALINERLAGLTLGSIRDTVSKRLGDMSGHGRLVSLIIDSKEKIWTDERAKDIHGTTLSEFLSQVQEEGLIITIGRESKFSKIMDCSLVTSSYRVGKISGTIGIIGPTRMPYNKLVSVVEHTARTITEVLSGIDKKRDV